MSLADCPHRPGTPEWSKWQKQFVRTEWDHRSKSGTTGATREDKVAAGLADAPTHLSRDYGRKLSDYPEPWRTEIERKMRVPPKAEPLQCPWCRRQYKREKAFYAHQCRVMRPDHPDVVNGLWEPYVDSHGRITGGEATLKQHRQWAEKARAAEQQRTGRVERYGAISVETAGRLMGTRRNPDTPGALHLLAELERLGWTPPK